VDIAPPQGGQEAGSGQGAGQLLGGLGHQHAVLGQRGTADDHDHVAGTGQSASRGQGIRVGRGRGDGGVIDHGPGQADGLTGAVAEGGHRIGRERGGSGRELDQRQAPVDDGRTQPEEEDRKLFAQIAGEDDHRVGRNRLVDGGPRQAEDHLGGKPVPHLGVDRIGAQDPLGQLGPGVGPFVGQARPSHHADGLGATLGRGGLQALGRGMEALVPRDRNQCAVLADEGLGQAVLRVDGLEGETALVAQPSVVDRVGVDAEQAGGPVGRGLHRHPAPHRTGRAGRLDLVQVPRAGGEAVGHGGERSDRADLHGVAREVRGEGELGERVHLQGLRPPDEVDLGLARHLVGEAGAPAALDAALPVEQHQLGDGDGLLEVALLLDETRLARAVGQGLILEGALAALVAHRAVERVVDQ
jgi:hypothetical protein